MTNYKKLILFFFCIGTSIVGFSQTNTITIKYIGNCGLYLSDGKSNLYIDFPYKSGAYNYMKYEDSEIDNLKENSSFLFTHTHADHYSKKLIKGIKEKHKGNVFGSWNTNKFEKLTKSFDDFNIEVFKTKHRFTIKHYSYLITWHGKRIYLSGDTESADTIASLKDINWAFVPTWIISDANNKQLKIDATKIGIYHLYPNEKINNGNPTKYYILNKQGEEIKIPY